jgi:biotin carboxyl carrier protein
MPKFQMVTVGQATGAVPPSENAGLQFEIDMVVDAINYHENGDETDPACCTGDEPCKTRIFLIGRQRDLATKMVGDRDAARAEYQAEVKEEIRAESVARSTPGNGIVADPASPAQVAYITSLAIQHDTSKIGTFPARTLAAIQDGQEVSKGRASRLIEVMKRQPKISAPIHQAETPAGPAASPAQIGFLRTLTAEHGEEIRTSYTKQEASDEITRLLTAREDAKKARTQTGPKVTEDGMYRTSDGTIYKVQIAKNGSGRLYAKKLTEFAREDGGTEWAFEIAKGAIFRLTPADKMTLADAQEFGKLYGVCCRCAADLTDEKSIERGMGPDCAGKM